MTQVTSKMLSLLGQSERPDIVQAVADNFNQYAPSYDVISDLRICHFIAQAALETDDFHTLTEYASGSAYEWRSDLGNTQVGDGPRYKGRGIFQLTGRANYAAMGPKLGVDLITNPDLAASPKYAVIIALEYWKSRNLNPLADVDNLNAITERINGGHNGLAERTNYLRMMKSLIKGDICLGVNDPVVKPYQTALKIQADGAFGPGTQAAVVKFQLEHALKPTGVLDLATRQTLLP
jgi:putative chitinase